MQQEELDKLMIYVDLLSMWQSKINLISNNTVHNIWERHILDSLQLIKFINKNKSHNIFDLGSGAGFPSIVLSIFAFNQKFSLIESALKAKGGASYTFC